MKLSLMRKFDDLSFMDKPETEMWYIIDSLFDTPKDLYETVDWFISHLPRQHDVGGKEWFKLVDIGEQARRYNSVTQKQKRLVGLLIAANWTKIEQTAEFGLL
jgi:hypothetical protein